MNSPYEDIRIVIADDDPMFGKALRDMVRSRFGRQIRLVYDGDAALHLMERGAPQLLITDMQMPGMHGAELVEEVKRRWPSVDVIAMTAFSSTYPYVEIIRAGASDFLSKPFHLEEMEAKVIRVLDARRQREGLIQEREQLLERVRAIGKGGFSGAGSDIRYRVMFESSMMPAIILDPENWHIRDANKAFCELCGSKGEDLRQRDFRDLLGATAKARFAQVADVFARTGRGALSDIAIESDGKSVAIVDISITFIGEDGERFVHIACKDVSEQKALQEELAERAAKDELTGLYNQRALRVRLESAVQTARTTGRVFSLISIDLDNFKQCNDKHGHPVGDGVLREAGRVILSQIRGRDAGFRNGGDEFCIILDAADAVVAKRVGERIRQGFAEADCFGTSMSVGVAEYRAPMDASVVLKAADSALYNAKSSGRNTTCVA